MIGFKTLALLVGLGVAAAPLFAYEFAIGLDARYDMAFIKDSPPSNQDTAEFKMDGLDGLLIVQFLPLDKEFVTPYIGLGLGMIPLYKGTSAKAVEGPGSRTITLKNITYATLEVGPEFVFKYIRWQVYAAYDYAFGGGKLIQTFSPASQFIPADDTKITRFNRFKIGTRVYVPVSAHFDIGLVGNYTFNGNFKDNGEIGHGLANKVTSYNFQEIDLGIALRARLY